MMNNDEYLTIKNVVITASRMVSKRCTNSTIVMYHAPILNHSDLIFNVGQQNPKYWYCADKTPINYSKESKIANYSKETNISKCV